MIVYYIIDICNVILTVSWCPEASISSFERKIGRSWSWYVCVYVYVWFYCITFIACCTAGYFTAKKIHGSHFDAIGLNCLVKEMLAQFNFSILSSYKNQAIIRCNHFNCVVTPLGVQSAAVSVICELARKNPKNYLSLAPIFFKLLTTSSNNWMLIKIIKLVSWCLKDYENVGIKMVHIVCEYGSIYVHTHVTLMHFLINRDIG